MTLLSRRWKTNNRKQQTVTNRNAPALTSMTDTTYNVQLDQSQSTRATGNDSPRRKNICNATYELQPNDVILAKRLAKEDPQNVSTSCQLHGENEAKQSRDGELNVTFDKEYAYVVYESAYSDPGGMHKSLDNSTLPQATETVNIYSHLDRGATYDSTSARMKTPTQKQTDLYSHLQIATTVVKTVPKEEDDNYDHLKV